MAKEKTLEKNLRERVRKLGGWAIKLWSLSIVGLPDRFILMPGGRIYFREIKETGKKPSPAQEQRIKKLRSMGFDAGVIDSNESLDDFITKIEMDQIV